MNAEALYDGRWHSVKILDSRNFGNASEKRVVQVRCNWKEFDDSYSHEWFDLAIFRPKMEEIQKSPIKNLESVGMSALSKKSTRRSRTGPEDVQAKKNLAMQKVKSKF